MNLNGDEKRIRQLFRDLNREEERFTPEFARVIAAAHSRGARTQNGTRLPALAWVVSAVVIAVLIAVSFALRHSKAQQPPGPDSEVAESNPTTESKAPIAVTRSSVGAPTAAAQQTGPRRVRRRRHSDELATRVRMLSAWQSPTASLLRSPREEMFKSLPRLGESLQSIKIFSPDEFN